jgi:light-regulated signal transduction histidine kinase (bacteriophytochrome)
LKMGNPDRNRSKDEIERLGQALEAETVRCLDLQRRLDRANTEFEEFVSLAAHNLREALRDVASFSQLMAETHAGRLDPEAGAFLARIRDGVDRAESLLAGMVDFLATDTGGRQFSRTDMNAVLNQALLSAARQIEERCALITHDPLPVVKGDFELLTKVLHHLIRNAIDYCDTRSPLVHISSGRVDLEWTISVRDNGPGIDSEFHKRIFEAFKRLHGRQHLGDGLGLAFCKKTIESHGGRMWVESAPGAGSTFYFTLPPAE